MPTRNINLTDHFDAFVDGEIAAGRYRNASEVMRAGLRLLEQQKLEYEQRLARLRELVAVGFEELDQGLGVALSSSEEIRKFVEAIGDEVEERHRTAGSATNEG